MSAVALFPAWLPKIVMSKNYASNRDIIVSVFMRGGADGLSLVRAVRRRELLHVAPDDRDSAARLDAPRRKGINLDNFFMFPPAMAGGVVNRRSHAAFQGPICSSCTRPGQLNNSRSHFDAQRYMEVGKPVDPRS